MPLGRAQARAVQLIPEGRDRHRSCRPPANLNFGVWSDEQPDPALGGGPPLDPGLCLLAARAVEHEQFWETGHVSDRLNELHELAAVRAQRRSWSVGNITQK